MVVLAGSKLQNCGDIVRFEIGIVRKDLLTHGTGGEEFEHILYTNTKTTNGRTAAANVCGHGDSIQRTHIGPRGHCSPGFNLSSGRRVPRTRRDWAVRAQRRSVTITRCDRGAWPASAPTRHDASWAPGADLPGGATCPGRERRAAMIHGRRAQHRRLPWTAKVMALRTAPRTPGAAASAAAGSGDDDAVARATAARSWPGRH